MKRVAWITGGLLVLLAGCGGGAGKSEHPFPPISQVGMNLTIDDLVARPDGAVRAETYLKEIEAAGYRKSVRFPYDRYWGPELSKWLPDLLRRHGFKAIVILSPGKHVDGVVDIEADKKWLNISLPTIADLLEGVQFANEPWNSVGHGDNYIFPPVDFVDWHNALLPIVKTIIPNVPILDGDIGGGSGQDWWEQVVQLDIKGVDVVSEHLYGHSMTEVDRPVWITEAGSLSDCYPGIPCWLYTWNEKSQWAKRPGGGILP
ncbi:MAG: hypothetical protein KGK17_00990 [Betaproteobacteria bacterium]|nr:hypothetical protein [Betaproteobacteria bacterium]